MNRTFGFNVAGAALAASLSCALAAPASATTFLGVRTFDGATVSLSITTDGATGALLESDITSYDVSVTDPSEIFDFTPADSQVLVQGTALTATPTALSFDFSAGSGLFLVEAATIGDSGPFYCADAGGTCDPGFTIGEQASTQYGESPLESVGESGVQVLATAGAVPEPATWALMLVGFGAAGATLRGSRRQRATA